VQCVAWQEGPLAEDDQCATQCNIYDIRVVNDTSAICEYKDDNNCYFHYSFVKKADGNETILVQKDKRKSTFSFMEVISQNVEEAYY